MDTILETLAPMKVRKEALDKEADTLDKEVWELVEPELDRLGEAKDFLGMRDLITAMPDGVSRLFAVDKVRVYKGVYKKS
jgi:hypothetical protein